MIFIDELGDLANPYAAFDSLKTSDLSLETLLNSLKRMIQIRLVEEEIAKLVISQKAKCPCHLGIGQEAIPVGISLYLRGTDRVFGAHRSHGHYLALGGSPYRLLAEVLGKQTGCSKGMGGSMHIVDREKGFAGSVPIVAGTIPLAVGAAMAAKMDNSQDIAVSYFGDGACEEGIVHESMNAAISMDLPILFVVENNLFSSHLDIHLRQPSNKMARFAEAHKINYAIVDGNDICKVAEVSQKMIAECRVNSRPGFIEAVTYRHLGHVGADANIDVGLRRKPEDIEAWQKKDPIKRLEDALETQLSVSKESIKSIWNEERNEISKALNQAMLDPYPPLEFIEKFVYKNS
jgi:pyruvate dehydrogenase E1 component alpha subunit